MKKALLYKKQSVSDEIPIQLLYHCNGYLSSDSAALNSYSISVGVTARASTTWNGMEIATLQANKYSNNESEHFDKIKVFASI